MSFDRRAEVSGPILRFSLSPLPHKRSDSDAWQGVKEQFLQSSMAVRELRDTASDLDRLEAAFWALKSAERLYNQVKVDAESRVGRLAA